MSTPTIYKFSEIKTIAIDLLKFIENLYNKNVANSSQEQSQQSPIPVIIKRTHLPLVLIILGILILLFVITFSFSVLRQMQFLNSSLDTSFNPTLSYSLLGFATLIAIAEIGMGVFFARKQKTAPLTKNYKMASIALLIGGLLLFGIVNASLVQSVISPIYNLTKPLLGDQEGAKNTPSETSDTNIEYINSENGIIEGHITDLALKPLSDVTVYEQNRKISTKTDSSGFFTFENVTPGQVMLSLTSPGYTSSIQGFNISAGMKIKKKFTMSTIGAEAGGIEGRVTLNNTPQQNIEVFTFAGGQIIKATTDINGNYVLQNIPPEDGYRIVAAKENYSPISEIVTVSSKINTKVDFNFATKLKGITVNGFISNKEGEIITNATVGFGYNSLLKTYSSSTGSDATGFYQTGDWQQSPWPNKIPIEVSATGYKTIKDEISPVVGTAYIKHYVLEKN